MDDEGFTVVRSKRKEKKPTPTQKPRGGSKKSGEGNQQTRNPEPKKQAPAQTPAPENTPSQAPTRKPKRNNKKAKKGGNNQQAAHNPKGSPANNQGKPADQPAKPALAELVQSFVPLTNEQPSVTGANLWKEINEIEEAEFAFLRGENLQGENTKLISVYENYATFRLVPRSAEELAIPYLYFSTRPPWRPHPTDPQVYPSVNTKQQFLERFAIFTENQFEGWSDWENMIVVGGAVVASLLPIPPSYQDRVRDYYHRHAFAASDIDIYFYGLDITQFSKKVHQFYLYLQRKNNGNVLVIRTPYTITFATQYPQRHIQIVIGQWDNIQQVLFEPDVGVSCVAFDGSRVWATSRARFGFNHRCIIASPRRYSVRGFPEYESRLLKYSKRGFSIWDEQLQWEKISGYYVKIAKRRLLEHSTVEGRADIHGLRLMITLHTYRDEMTKVDIMGPKSGEQKDPKRVFQNEGLPYGPKWDTSKLRAHIAKGVFSRSHYGPYKLDEPLVLINTVSGHESIVSPHRDKLVKFSLASDSWRDRSWYSRAFISEERQEKDNPQLDYDDYY